MRKSLLLLAIIIAISAAVEAQPSGSWAYSSKVGITREPGKPHPNDKDVPNNKGDNNGSKQPAPINSSATILLIGAAMYGVYLKKEKSSSLTN